jgi:hypothetical protein
VEVIAVIPVTPDCIGKYMGANRSAGICYDTFILILKDIYMGKYGSEHRGRRIMVFYNVDPGGGGVTCVVMIDDIEIDALKGVSFRTVHAAQTTGAAFARALINAELDGDSVAHRGYFIRASSSEQRDGSWIGTYQLHRNDNPVPFRRATCSDFRGNTSVEAEEHAIQMAQQAVDAEIAAGTL